MRQFVNPCYKINKPMQKPMLITIIIIVALVLTAGGYFGYRYWQNRAVVIETRDFSCPGMTGFIFKYPVFKDWEVGKITGNSKECNIWLNSQGFTKNGIDTAIAPSIVVQKIEATFSDFLNETQSKDRIEMGNWINPQDVIYLPLPFPKGNLSDQTDEVHFYLQKENKQAIIKAALTSSKYGFSNKQFFKTVVESFRLVK